MDLVGLVTRWEGLVGLIAMMPMMLRVKHHVGAQNAPHANSSSSQKEKLTMLPLCSFVLFLLAELCSSVRLLNPEDTIVKRAVKRGYKVTSTSKSSVMGVMSMVIKLFDENSVFEAVRFAVSFSTCMSLVLSLSLGSPGQGAANQQSFWPQMKHVGRALANMLPRLRMWGVVTLMLCFVIGHKSELVGFLKESTTIDLLKAIGPLLRCLAVVTAVIGTYGEEKDDHFLIWTASQAAAAVARAAKIGLRNDDLLRGTADVSVWSSLLLEGFCLVVVAPYVVRSRRLLWVFCLLALPAVMIVTRGPNTKILWNLTVGEAMNVLAGAMAILSVVCTIMGGFFSALTTVFLLQFWIYLYQIEGFV